MSGANQATLFAAQSLRAAGSLPETTKLQGSSRDLGWSTILVDDFVTFGNREELCESATTPDVKISVGLAGMWDVWAMRFGRWESAVLQAGSVNIAASDESRTLRWKNRSSSSPFRVAVAYLSPRMLEETADYFKRPGGQMEHRIPSTVVMNDQIISGTVSAMVQATGIGACDLYAEQASRWLATHLIHSNCRAFDPNDDLRSTGRISDPRLRRVLEYIRVNLGNPISITELAQVAAVSPFHFCRLFSCAVGMSPHRFLVDRRMSKAETLLRTTEISLAEIAGMCGYSRANAFASAFQRHTGQSQALIGDSPLADRLIPVAY